MSNSTNRDVIEAAKAASTAQLLLKTARLVNAMGVHRLRAHLGVPIRQSHTALFPHIDLDGGTRLTELARRLGVSKQAAAQLVDELVKMGLLERVPDPQDGRARRICFSTAEGRTLLDGLAVLGSVESDLQSEIGAARMRALHDALGAALEWLEAQPEAGAE